jgi:hypothetical protein
MRLGALFRGNIIRGQPDTQLVVLFDCAVNATRVRDLHKASMKPPPFTEWEGLKWTYFIWGLSNTRPGGFEAKSTETAPNPRGRSHSWTITFPINGEWVELAITNGGGGLEWNAFEEIGSTIIRSVEAI